MASKKSLFWIASAWLAIVSPGGPVAWAQQAGSAKEDSPGQPDPKRLAWLHEVYLGEASDYAFYLDGQKQEKLELRREPVMRWISGGDFHGEVYVWTHHGAAAVVGSIFSRPQGDESRYIMHEFHSLASQPLVSGDRRGPKWQPEEPGIKLEPIPDAPEPARTPVLRLAQMRDLARRFTAHVDRRGGMDELRLLPQPLYRYEIKDAGPVVDGAVFTYIWTAGTDPEVLLVIEARRTDSGVRWHFAPARFTNREARVSFQGREIWKADGAAAGVFDGVTSKPYAAFGVKTVARPADAP